MKQMTCEMCGSTNLVKQDGVFVCQDCGCKYSLEEAKKLLVEGHIDISGSTVKVDMSSKIHNLYILARRAKKEKRYGESQEYYRRILLYEPDSWEAYFNSGSFTWSNINQDVLLATFNFIDEMPNKTKKHEAYSEIAKSCTANFGNWLVKTNEYFSSEDIKKNGKSLKVFYNLILILEERGIKDFTSELKELFEKCVMIWIKELEQEDKPRIAVNLLYELVCWLISTNEEKLALEAYNYYIVIADKNYLYIRGDEKYFKRFTKLSHKYRLPPTMVKDKIAERNRQLSIALVFFGGLIVLVLYFIL